MEGISTLENCFDTDWVCSSNEAVKIRFVRPLSETDNEHDETKVKEFTPEFTYPIFGDKEQIFGYKNLSIKLYYASGSLTTYFDVTYDKKAPLADNAVERIKEFIPNDFITNYDTFLQTIKSDSENFRPMGEKFSEYRLNDDDDRVYEIYKATFVTPRFKEFHRRLQIFVLFYIEAGSYIDEDDDKWEIALIFEKKTVGDSKVYSIVGYCTMYMYYFLTGTGNSNENHTNAHNKPPLHLSINQGGQIRDNIRVRISQFLILPHYQREGHGNKFYQALYQSFLADPRIKEITVEDSSDRFQEIRDKNDIRFLRENRALEDLKAPVDKNVFNELQKKYKLNKRQMARCIEIELLRNLNKTDPVAYKAYRLQVKQRLYLWNEDILRQLDRAERIQKLEETFKGLEEDYYSIILQL